jgi:bacteriorhodopsin
MCHLMKSSFVAAASILSHIILCVLALSVGAITIAPFKFWWWGAGCTFFALVAMQIRAELVTARKTAASTAGFAGTMSVFAFIWSAVFVAVWLLGQEGAAVMSRPLETCLLVLADLALKGGLFAYVLSAVESGPEEASGKELQARQPPSTVQFYSHFPHLSPFVFLFRPACSHRLAFPPSAYEQLLRFHTRPLPLPPLL